MTKADATFSGTVAGFLVKTRRSFFKMSMREKSLVLLFAFALAGVWFSWQLERQQSTLQSINAAHSEAEEHEMILSYSPSIQADFQQLVSQINLQSLPSKDEVSGRIDALVREANFDAFDVGQARTEEGTGFRFHTIQIVVQKVTYEQIKNFTETLKAELPFVSLERIVIQAQARDDAFLDVRYVLKSIEYTQ